jgi:hypothetical protein
MTTTALPAMAPTRLAVGPDIRKIHKPISTGERHFSLNEEPQISPNFGLASMLLSARRACNSQLRTRTIRK